MTKRGIKVRAWNGKRHDHMDSWESLTQGYDAPLSILNGIDGVTIEQYTGLKDVNGVEIYEGDILKDRNVISWVVFENGGFWAKSNNPVQSEPAYLGDYNFESIVIGNIHETPELLEV